jgi:hypothetical protein
MKLRLASSVIVLCALIAPAVPGDCKCGKPEKEDKTRWGGNQSVVLVPEGHYRQISGIVEEAFANQKVKDALAEVFDKPEYLVGDKPWNERPQQNRLRACVTSSGGKFCFKDLPTGTYELRISRDSGWDVTHVYVVVDRGKGTNKMLHIRMQIGT